MSDAPIPNISAGKPKGDGPAPVRRSKPKDAPAKKRQIWCAFKPDASDFVVFGAEIEAMRYAVRNEMQCVPVSFGESLRAQTHTLPEA